MRTLWALPEDRQKAKAHETLDIFAPIAHHLGIHKIKSELEDLSLRYLKPDVFYDIAEKLKVARSYGDLSENSEYDEAKSEQAKIEARISELEYQLDNVEIVDSVDKDAVSMGSKLKVKRISDGVELSFEIVGFAQSNPAEGKISDESPIGMALMGKKQGEKVTVEAPIGNLDYEILSIN